MKIRAKKTISLVMVVAVLLGLLPISAFAAEPAFDPIRRVNDEVGSDKEIAYFTMGEDGLVASGTAGEALGWTSDGTENGANWTARVKEELMPLVASDTVDPNTDFDLKLTVQTKSALSNIPVQSGAAITLVVDLSGSMSGECATCGGVKENMIFAMGETGTSNYYKNHHHDAAYPYSRPVTDHAFESRLDATKRVLTQFVTDYADAAGGSGWLSIVTYSNVGDTSTLVNWKSMGAENVAGILASIDGMTGKTVTYTTSGLNQAIALQGTLPAAANQAKRSVILLTDGFPSPNDPGKYGVPAAYAGEYSDFLAKYNALFDEKIYKTVPEIDRMYSTDGSDKNDFTFKNWIGGQYSTNFQENVQWINPAIAGYNIRSGGADFYTVSFASGILNGLGGRWLQDITAPGFSYTADSADELKDAFGKILDKTVGSGVGAGASVSLKMGDMFNFIGGDKSPNVSTDVTSASSPATYDELTRTLTWNVGASSAVTPDEDKAGLVSGEEIHTYELRFRVKLNNLDQMFKENTWYQTNNKTTLNYQHETTENGQVTGSEKRTLNFKVPMVHGLTPMAEYTYVFQKYNRTTGRFETVETSAPMEAKLWSTIEIDGAKKAEYADKYKTENYELTNVTSSVKLGLDATQNVIIFQYTQLPSTILVNHWIVETVLDGTNMPVQKMTNVPQNITGKFPGETFDVTPLPADEGYELVNSVDFEGTTYSTDAYTGVTVKLEGNVVNLYYTVDNRAPVDFTVEHYTYSFDWVKEDGVWTEKQTDDTLYKTDDTITYKQYDNYSATKNSGLLGSGYTFDEARSDSLTGKLDADKTVKLYYSIVTNKPDDSLKGTLTVVHNYVAYKTVVGADGKPVDVVDSANSHTETEPAIDIYVGEVRSATPNTGYGDGKWEISSKPEEYQNKTMVPDANNANANTITINYKSTAATPDERPEKDVTVIHKFEAYKYAVNGEPVATAAPDSTAAPTEAVAGETVAPTDAGTSETIAPAVEPAVLADETAAPTEAGTGEPTEPAAGAGEDGTLNQTPVRDPDSDLPDITDILEGYRVGDVLTVGPKVFSQDDEHWGFVTTAVNVEYTVVDGENVITITYSRMPALPEHAGIAIVHNFTTTRSFVDADGNIQKSQTGQFPVTINDEHAFEDGYIGEYVKVDPISSLGEGDTDVAGAWGDDYRFVKDGSSGELDSELGTQFKVYKQPLTQNGELVPYIINYVREANELVPENEATLEVYPVWVTTHDYVDDNGVVQYQAFKEFTVGTTPWSPAGPLYATQKYSVLPSDTGFASEGFVFDSSLTVSGIAGQSDKALKGNSYNDFRMGAAGTTTTVYLIYVQNIDDRGTLQDVIVNHNYTTTTYTMVGGVATPGVPDVTQEGGKVTQLYPKQRYTPVANAKGFTHDNPEALAEYTVEEKPLVIDLNYSREDKSHLTPTELTIVHHYVTYDWQGNVYAESVDKTVAGGNLYAEQTMTVPAKFPGGNDPANPFTVNASIGQLEPGDVAEGDKLGEAIGGKVIDAKTMDGNETDGYVATLAEGSNVIVLLYEKTVETRNTTKVTVIHQYYQRSEADMNVPEGAEKLLGTLVAKNEKTLTEFSDGVWVGNQFWATLEETYTPKAEDGTPGESVTYTFNSAEYDGGAMEPQDGKVGPITLYVLVENQGHQTITITYVRDYETPENPNPDPDPNPNPNPEPEPTPEPTPSNPVVTPAPDDEDNDEPEPKPSAKPAPSGEPTPAPEVPVVPGTDDNQTPVEDEGLDIGENDIPLSDMPAVVPPIDEEFIILDEESPLGNLPQTGTKDQHGGGLMAMMGLSALLAAGGAALMNRKKENKD